MYFIEFNMGVFYVWNVTKSVTIDLKNCWVRNKIIFDNILHRQVVLTIFARSVMSCLCRNLLPFLRIIKLPGVSLVLFLGISLCVLYAEISQASGALDLKFVWIKNQTLFDLWLHGWSTQRIFAWSKVKKKTAS